MKNDARVNLRMPSELKSKIEHDLKKRTGRYGMKLPGYIVEVLNDIYMSDKESVDSELASTPREYSHEVLQSRQF
jgi:predicted DNA binding CopG/RHH family protein